MTVYRTRATALASSSRRTRATGSGWCRTWLSNDRRQARGPKKPTRQGADLQGPEKTTVGGHPSSHVPPGRQASERVVVAPPSARSLADQLDGSRESSGARSGGGLTTDGRGIAQRKAGARVEGLVNLRGDATVVIVGHEEEVARPQGGRLAHLIACQKPIGGEPDQRHASKRRAWDRCGSTPHRGGDSCCRSSRARVPRVDRRRGGRRGHLRRREVVRGRRRCGFGRRRRLIDQRDGRSWIDTRRRPITRHTRTRIDGRKSRELEGGSAHGGSVARPSAARPPTRKNPDRKSR